MNNKKAISKNRVPAILWVRSSFSNCFTATFSSLSDFNVSLTETLDLADFTFVAIGTKVIKTVTEKAVGCKGIPKRMNGIM